MTRSNSMQRGAPPGRTTDDSIRKWKLIAVALMVSVGIGCGSSNNPPTASTETPNPTATRTPTVPIPNLVAGCARLNIAEVDLDAFNPASNSIVADLGALLANSDINANQPNTAVGCESDPDDQDCAPMFTNLGLHFSDGTPSPATQRFFRVE